MKKSFFSILVTCSLGILLMAASFIWNIGCGSGTDNEITASSEDASKAAEAVVLVGLEVALDPSGNGSFKTLKSTYFKNMGVFKTAFTATSASSCSERSLPSLSSGAAEPWTLSGSAFTCENNAGSGSCEVTYEETPNDRGMAIIDCNNLIIPVLRSGGSICDNINLDGKLGIEYAWSYSDGNTTIDIDFSSEDLMEVGMNCDLNLAFSFNQTTDGSGSGTQSTNGCLAECGDAFTLTGSDTL